MDKSKMIFNYMENEEALFACYSCFNALIKAAIMDKDSPKSFISGARALYWRGAYLIDLCKEAPDSSRVELTPEMYEFAILMLRYLED